VPQTTGKTNQINIIVWMRLEEGSGQAYRELAARYIIIIMVEIAVYEHVARVRVVLGSSPFQNNSSANLYARVDSFSPTHNNTYENTTYPVPGRRINSVTATHTANDKLSVAHRCCCSQSSSSSAGSMRYFSRPVVGRENRTRYGTPRRTRRTTPTG